MVVHRSMSLQGRERVTVVPPAPLARPDLRLENDALRRQITELELEKKLGGLCMPRMIASRMQCVCGCAALVYVAVGLYKRQFFYSTLN